MEISNLILSIDEGPKKGESIERKPGRSSSIRIGRILRGNNICIKDPAISQNHLIIDFQPLISRWAVTDLGASNGAAVNGSIIPPNAAFPLSDGDTIEIGENTLMSVKMSAASSAPERRTRRGRPTASDVVEGRRRTRASAKLEELMKSGESTLMSVKISAASSEPEPRTRRGRPAASDVVEGRRRTRASAKLEEQTKSGGINVEALSGLVMKEKEVLENIKPAKLLKRRNVKDLSVVKKSCAFVDVEDEEGESLEKIGELVNVRRGRRRGKKDDVLEQVVVEGNSRVHEFEDGGIKEAKVELVNNRGKTKVRRGGRSKQILRKGEEDKGVVVEDSTNEGKKLTGRKKVVFRVEEVENSKDEVMMSRQSNKEGELTKSWSSFSEIRGIPNTTSKYREV